VKAQEFACVRCREHTANRHLLTKFWSRYSHEAMQQTSE